MLPKLLYRGDSDKDKIRDLRGSLKQFMLYTNLINGGIGHDIFKKPLFELLRNHIDPGWPKTHFLSFSEYENTARDYGKHRANAFKKSVNF